MSKLYVVGIGPGAYEKMTIQAQEVLEQCDTIVGYTVYVDLLRDYFPQAEFVTTPMMREVERCKHALEICASGKQVAMVCSGDAGIYGMAGLVLELAVDYKVEVEIVAGVTAASGGSAILGAPLMHDFCVISLSDLLTPWEKIEKRLLLSAQADLVQCLYNPSSKKRADYLEKAVKLCLTAKSPETICGIARKIGRVGESYEIMTLGELQKAKVDMFSTVFIGNEETRIVDGKMVTPRGYSKK